MMERITGKHAEDMPLEWRQHLRFWKFTTKHSKDGVAVGMTFTTDGEPETAVNHIWFGVALTTDQPATLQDINGLFGLLRRRFDDYLAGKPNPFPEPVAA